MRITAFPVSVMTVACSVCLLLGSSGCLGSRAVDPQKLPGVWRSPQDGYEITSTFQENGAVRWQLDHNNALLRVLTGGVDLQGQWRLDGDQLRIEMQELPPNTELFGGRWHGRQLIVHVRTLTDQHLQFVDSDLKFQRGLVPSAKR